MHPLDRPVWTALTTRLQRLAVGSALAVRMRAEIGTFAAAFDRSDAAQRALSALIKPHEEVSLVETEAMAAPPGTVVVRCVPVSQMIATQPVTMPDITVVELGDVDAAEAHALAALTKPGPYAAMTHRLGGFVGVRIDGRLAAMAGERLRVDGFGEVTAVCSHPDYRGHGYGGLLARLVTARVQGRGETPFLHVNVSNPAAAALYERLGYVRRREMVQTVIERG